MTRGESKEHLLQSAPLDELVALLKAFGLL